jgi:hypothetical protein
MLQQDITKATKLITLNGNRNIHNIRMQLTNEAHDGPSSSLVKMIKP